MNIWSEFPQLAKGTFDRNVGKGCVMNTISYVNGDVEITDMPSCTHPVISKWMQRLNDSICTHTNSDLLCSDCSSIVLGYAPLIIGTEAPKDKATNTKLQFKMALAIRHLVEPHLTGYGHTWYPQLMDSISDWDNGLISNDELLDKARLLLSLSLVSYVDVIIDTYYEFTGKEKPTIPVEEAAVCRIIKQAAENGATYCEVGL